MSTEITPNRIENYLSAYKFFSNNIEFRIISSKAIEQWKNVQAFQLRQLINGKFFFAKDSREILLLKYDLWSRFLYEVESYCIETAEENNTVKADKIDFILLLAEKTSSTFKELTAGTHKDKFDQSFVNILFKLHELPHKYLIYEIKSLEKLELGMFFSKLVTLVASIMQHTLIELYELDNIDSKKNDTNFVIVTRLDDIIFKTLGEHVLIDRLKIYKEYCNFTDIYIKNYTDAPIQNNIISRIEKLKYKIDFRKSIVES